MDSTASEASSGWKTQTTTFSNALARTITVALALFVISFASISLTRETNSIATLWPANAVLLAVLLRGPSGPIHHALMLAGATLAFFLSNMACGNSLPLSAALTAANVGEVVVAHWLLFKCGCATSDISRPRNLTFFLVLAAGAAPLVGATVGAAAVSVALEQPLLRLWLTWYAADALGMAIVTPFALVIGAEQLRHLQTHRRVPEAVALVFLILAVGGLASYYRSFLFVAAPLVLFATFRFGVLGAATATFLVAIIASSCIVFGIGAPILAQSGISERIFALQIFLAAIVLWSLPVAAALAERDRFAAQLSRAKDRAEAVSETKSQAVIRLQRRLWKAEEGERLRLAHEIHDHTGQSLAVTMLELKQIERVVHGDGLQSVHRLRAQLDEMGRTLHHIASELRPASIDELGLARALEEYVSAWGEKFGIDAELHCGDLHIDRRPDEVRTTIYRVTQEALTNIAKHASGANAVSVSIHPSGDFLRLTIEDNGCGFDAVATDSGKRAGLGLAGMRERLSFVDGDLDIESTIGAGTTLFARIPLKAGAVP